MKPTKPKPLPIVIGETVGSWTVLEEAEAPYWLVKKRRTEHCYRCQCKCGATKVISSSNLRRRTPDGCVACLPKNEFNLYRFGSKRRASGEA